MTNSRAMISCLGAVALAAVSLAGLTACQDQKQTPQGQGSVSDPMADINVDKAEKARITRPPRATSIMSSDPNNPNGVPGPSTGLGSSPQRY